MLYLAHPNRGKMLIALLLGAVVIGGAVGTLVFSMLGSANKRHGAQKEPVAQKLIPVEEIVVNLADAREPHYLKTSIVLEVHGASAEHEAETLMPKIRDAAISVLSAQLYQDLLKPQQRERLKESIKKRVNAVMGESKVVSVYFSDFAIQ
mgnify:FL=1